MISDLIGEKIKVTNTSDERKHLMDKIGVIRAIFVDNSCVLYIIQIRSRLHQMCHTRFQLVAEQPKGTKCEKTKIRKPDVKSPLKKD